MFVFIEDKQPLLEAVQTAGKREYDALLSQIKENPSLARTLNTPISTMPKYHYLTDHPIIKTASLLQIIEGSMQWPTLKSYFIKSSKGLYVGFIAINISQEGEEKSVNDVKVFSFGLENDADENQIYKDIPSFLDKCLAEYKKISWTAIEGNKANRAYEVYTKRHNGTITKDGKYLRYTCAK